MSIHSEHPFATPEGLRDPLRRLRGRLAQPVSVWAAGELANGPEGWTISSMLIAEGDPPEVLGLLDPDSDLADRLADSQAPDGPRVSVNLLAEPHTAVADAFARLAPSPGGPFRTGTWTDSPYGPRLEGAAGWLGVRLQPAPADSGWSLLLRGIVESAEVGPGEPLYHLRGAYRS